MANKVTKTLFSLLDVDSHYFSIVKQVRELEKEKVEMLTALERAKSAFSQKDGILKETQLQQSLEEHRLRDEQQKIVERKKQLANFASDERMVKLIEREIDLASRTVHGIEESALKAIEAASAAQANFDVAKADLETLQQSSETKMPDWEKKLAELQKELAHLKKDREKYLAGLDTRLAALYDRVSRRYPGSAVAIAQSGSCRSCYRALPVQTYNQVIAGNTCMQCPGCSRILIYQSKDES